MFSNSVFGEILKQLPRGLVADCVARHEADKWVKRFRSRDHLVAMLVAQFAGASSLRELETVFNSQASHHYHLNAGPVRRATLADANATRTPDLFRDIAMALIQRGGKAWREAGAVLSILDASTITLAGRGLAWAEAGRTRAGNQGLKLHLEIDHETRQPRYLALTGTTVNDVTQALDLPLEAGRVYVFDKGYCDYNWWNAIIQAGSGFVTRLKRNAAFKVIESRPAEAEGILRDQIITLTNKSPGGKRTNQLAGVPLRLIHIPHPAGKAAPFWIVSDDLKAPAARIAGHYKARWSIELLFKWLKQNLKIKRFIAENRNAVMIQIFVAMIAYILLKRFHDATKTTLCNRLKDLLSLVAANLFARPQTVVRKRMLKSQIQAIQHNLWDNHRALI